MRSPKDTEELLRALGIDCKMGDEVFELVASSSPTVKAYIQGEITIQEALFIENYLSNGFNAARAAEAASYGALTAGAYGKIGQSVAKKPAIRKIISRRIAEKALNADEVLAEWAEVAKADMTYFLTLTTVNHPLHDEPISVAVPDLAKAAALGKLHLVKKVKMDINGNFSLELRDQDAALLQIARNHGMFEKDNALTIPRGLAELLNATAEVRREKIAEYRQMLEGEFTESAPEESED